MKGDFSRFTFDPTKHYRSVYMQQGRVQLDADWNEQIDILNHYLESHLLDLLGPSAGPRASAGFKITMVERHVEEQETMLLPRVRDQKSEGGKAEPGDQAEAGKDRGNEAAFDFRISHGHYYVDGILCENDEGVLFSEQPGYPRAEIPANLKEFALVYLDVWQHHITAFEQPAILETALGNLDTTTRVQNLWQAKILPIGHHRELSHSHEASYRDIVSLSEWHELRNRQHRKPLMSARHNPHSTRLDNQLYRVEIHSVEEREHEQHATFKWSRENGSIVFDIAHLEQVKQPQGQEHGKGQKQDEHRNMQLTITLGHLGRDITLLHNRDWVEIVDEALVLDGLALPLYQVMQAPDATLRQVILQGPYSSYLETLTKESTGKQQVQHLLLRRWDHDSSTSAHGVMRVREDEWQNLEYGIQVRFNADGHYQVGDYWLIPSRTLSDSIEWPVDEQGNPQERPPHGVYHHFCPLALLHLHEDGTWKVAKDVRQLYDALPLVSMLAEKIRPPETDITEIIEILPDERPAARALYEECASDERLSEGDLVSLVPGPTLRVVRATRNNAPLVFGVISGERMVNEERLYRVTTYGRARCNITEECKAGDLLTVAEEIDGCATRTGPAHRLFSPGTTLGKALENYDPADEDKVGRIEIMVSLH
jgi:hypothetical protein